MELKQNPYVKFFEDEHRYSLVDEDFNMRDISGITAILKDTVFPNMYGDVSEDVLQRAAMHGSLCHKLCEDFDNAQLTLTDDGTYVANNDIVVYSNKEPKVLIAAGETITDKELYEYIKLVKENDLYVEASEYLVSDNEHYASSIDKVLRESAKEFSIVDLKFTYAFHEDYVSWQTSYYADMFEKQNPDCKIKNLYCIHIHVYNHNDGTSEVKAQLHKLSRIKTEYLEEAKRCHLNGLPFDNPLSKVDVDIDADAKIEIDGTFYTQEQCAKILRLEKRFTAMKKAITDIMKKSFAENPNIGKLKGTYFSVAQSTASTSESIDTKKLKEQFPDVYRECKVVKTNAPRTTITLNK